MQSPFPEVNPAETPEEMRAELYRLQRDDPLVRTAMISSQMKGLSAEDTYTVLAYHAVKAKNELQNALYEKAIHSPAPMLKLMRPMRPMDRMHIFVDGEPKY